MRALIIILSLLAFAPVPATGTTEKVHSAAFCKPDFRIGQYQAHVLSVYDGDTIRADILLGLGVVLHNQAIRLAGIDAPEMRGEERPYGITSRDWLRNRIGGREIILETSKDKRGKYGRLIATVWIEDDGVWSSVNDQIVAAGHALPLTTKLLRGNRGRSPEKD